MEMTGSRLINARREVVWEALNDAAALQACIPGCESLDRTSGDEWRAALVAKVGPVSARFAGKMRITDSTPPATYTLKFEGQGGAAGFANGEARVTLTPATAESTTLDYAVKAQIGGKLAQIGSRLVDGAAAKLANDFFARFEARFAPAVDANADAAAPPAIVPATGVVAPSGSLRAVRYIAIAALLAVLAYLYFNGARR